MTFSRSGDGLYTKPVGPGEPQQLLPVRTGHWLVGWTPDARTLVAGVMEGSLSSIVALTDGQTRRVIEPANTWGGRLSPDGEWLAYSSLDSENFKVVVTRLRGGERWAIADGSDPNEPRVAVETFLPPLYDDLLVATGGSIGSARQ